VDSVKAPSDLCSSIRQSIRWVPGRHRRQSGEAIDFNAYRPTFTWLNLTPTNEPGVDPRPDRDRVPHLLGGGFDIDLVFNSERTPHAVLGCV